ncbi:hypothetical protein ACSBR2_027236 [Camellia fascicularis]
MLELNLKGNLSYTSLEPSCAPPQRQAYTNHSFKWLKMLSPSVNSIGQSTHLIFFSTALLLPRSKSGLLCAAVCFF